MQVCKCRFAPRPDFVIFFHKTDSRALCAHEVSLKSLKEYYLIGLGTLAVPAVKRGWRGGPSGLGRGAAGSRSGHRETGAAGTLVRGRRGFVGPPWTPRDAWAPGDAQGRPSSETPSAGLQVQVCKCRFANL